MNFLIRCLLLLSVSGTLKAEFYGDNLLFGVSLIRQYAEMETLVTGATSSLSETGAGLGFYLDKYVQRNFRINGTFSYVVYSEFDVIELMFSADYLIPANETFSFFVGVAGGGIGQKHMNAVASDYALGGAYGAQFGAMKFINENIMVEMGYRYRQSNITTDVGTTVESRITLEQVNEFYFSTLFMF